MLVMWGKRTNPFVLVNANEWIVLLRAGKLKKVLKTGIHFFPLKVLWIDGILFCSNRPDTYRLSGINITTLDGKTANFGVCVEWVIEDPIKFLWENTTAEGNFHDICWGTSGEYLN